MSVNPLDWIRLRHYLAAEDWVDTYEENHPEGELTIFIKSLPNTQEWAQTKEIVEKTGLRPVMHDPRA